MSQYDWSQTNDFITITYNMNNTAFNNTACINVLFKPDRILIYHNNDEILTKELPHSIYPSDSFWYLEKKKDSNEFNIILELSKQDGKNKWWNQCFIGDEPKQYNPQTIHINELSDEEKQYLHRTYLSHYSKKQNK